ncbi:glycoside hydrolase family 79 protein [Xylogone sp. PMI_703]|nr:glycoside hydrolase family 79 protein [Xylogone sp. PMI_703]
MPFFWLTTALLPLVTAAAVASTESVDLELSVRVPSSASPPVSRDFQSFSIEFSSWVDYAGNISHPNEFTNTMFANLRAFNGDVPQIIRIGGNTQDHVTYDPQQKQDIINYWDYSYNSDQPRNSTIGPAFWETFTASKGTKFIFGLNFYKNDSYYLENLHGQVEQSLRQIPADRLHLFELGNENDYGALSGFRPPTWTQQDWVNEWISRTTHIQTPGNHLRFYAPSCCCFNITTPYSFFSPWTIWNKTFNYDRDGWINEVSQHGYISGTSLNPTLQGTLMNHTSVKINCSLHVDLNTMHTAAGRTYTIGETNSVSGQGSHGVSDVFGSAMFIVDYELYLASKGISRMHLHQGTSYRYAAWLPIVVNGTGPTVKPPYYGHIFISKFIGSSRNTRINNIDLNSDYYSAYAAYENGKLDRIAILNFHAWDPSDSTSVRPQVKFDLGSIKGYSYATVELMTAPGATADTNITVAGISYDYEKAQGRPVKVGSDIAEIIKPQNGHRFTVNVGHSQAVIVNFHH